MRDDRTRLRDMLESIENMEKYPPCGLSITHIVLPDT